MPAGDAAKRLSKIENTGGSYISASAGWGSFLALRFPTLSTFTTPDEGN